MESKVDRIRGGNVWICACANIQQQPKRTEGSRIEERGNKERPGSGITLCFAIELSKFLLKFFFAFLVIILSHRIWNLSKYLRVFLTVPIAWVAEAKTRTRSRFLTARVRT